MGILDFFTGGTARIQALLIGVLVGLVLLMGTAGVALWWRSEAYQARAQRDVALAQGKVLAEGVKACSASVDLAHKIAGKAIDQGTAMLAEARRLTAGGQNQIKKIEDLLAKKPPPDADCRAAWAELEDLYRKAGAAP